VKHEVELDVQYEFGVGYTTLVCSCGWQQPARLGPLSEILAQRGEHLRDVGAELSRYVRANMTGNTVQDIAEYATAGGIRLAGVAGLASVMPPPPPPGDG
jgi:hypothetical protein